MELQNTVGNYCKSVALSTVLNYYGYPLSESMCFGLSAAFDFSYSEVMFGSNNYFKCFSGNNENDFSYIAELLKLDFRIYQPENRKKVRKLIDKYMYLGNPLIASVSIDKYLKHLKNSLTNGFEQIAGIFNMIGSSVGNHVTVVVNSGEEAVMIYEPNIFEPVVIPWDSFFEALNPKNSFVMNPANTIYYFKPTKSFEEMKPLLPMLICNAIYENMYTYLNANDCWFGIEQIKQFGKTFFTTGSKESIKDNARMLRFFCDIITGGGFYRRLYSRFLKEVGSSYVEDHIINDAASQYNKICKQWSNLSKDISNDVERINQGNVDKWTKDIEEIYQRERAVAIQLCKRGDELRNVL